MLEAARRASGRFAWYSEMLRERGLVGQAHGAQVPVLHEADLAATYYADPTEAAADETVYVTSGTSTGARKRVRWTALDHRRYVAQRAGLFERLLGGSCRTACADLGTGHAAASGIEIFAAIGLEGREIDVAWPIERHVELLREWQPDLLYTMPMILERIVEFGGPGYVPKWIIVLGDIAPPAWRAALCDRLGMDAGHIADVFGSIESGAIAYSDDSIGGYLFHEHIVPEVIAPAEPRDDGGQLLLLTSLERDAFPVVRYAAGDIVSGLRPVVVDGRRHWAYDRHLGREGAEIKHGEMLSLYTMAGAIGAVAPGVPWGVRRAGLEVVVELDAPAYSASVADAVRRAIREAHPAVDRMIRSGLVGDLRIEPVPFVDGTAKRSIA